MLIAVQRYCHVNSRSTSDHCRPINLIEMSLDNGGGPRKINNTQPSGVRARTTPRAVFPRVVPRMKTKWENLLRDKFLGGLALNWPSFSFYQRQVRRLGSQRAFNTRCESAPPLVAFSRRDRYFRAQIGSIFPSGEGFYRALNIVSNHFENIRRWATSRIL